MFSQFRSGYGLLKPPLEPPRWSVSRFTTYRHFPTGGGGSGSVRVCPCSLLLGSKSFIFGLKYDARKGFVVDSRTCFRVDEQFHLPLFWFGGTCMIWSWTLQYYCNSMCVVVCVPTSCSISDGLTWNGNCRFMLFCRKLIDFESLLCW
jgi:hypothetical protein